MQITFFVFLPSILLSGSRWPDVLALLAFIGLMMTLAILCLRKRLDGCFLHRCCGVVLQQAVDNGLSCLPGKA
jgi:hypothetical protein